VRSKGLAAFFLGVGRWSTFFENGEVEERDHLRSLSPHETTVRWWRVELTPGQIIGNDYRVVQLLAAGGMGQVYVAEQLSTGKRRALKVMHRDLASDAESQRRFMQEARVGSLIASEHIVEVQNAGIDSATGHPYLVMELLEGEDLQTRLARGPLSLDEARAILGQLCHALGAAHDAHVVHRDLKPQNIFLGVRRSTGDTLHVKVLDFGIAKVTENRNATAATGTPMWLAPEQTERSQITSAADVWALGLIVFTMMTGGIFWRAPSRKNGGLVDLLGEILRDPIPSASARAAELGRSLPPGFDGWFVRCLSRPPGGRFQTAREAYAALVPILGSAARPLPAPPVLPPGPLAVTAPAMMHSALPAMSGTNAPYFGTRAPAPARSSGLGLVLGVVLGLVILLGLGAVVVAMVARNVVATAPTLASTVPTGVSPASAPFPQPTKESGDVNLMVISDDPQLQAALLSDATLTPKVEECVASVRGKKEGSIVLVFEVVSGAVKPIMTQAQPLGPHVQCVTNAITNRSLQPSKKKASLQVMVTWS
jgi:serine/threonine protein kinase